MGERTRILVAGTFDPGMSRNCNMLALLDHAGVDVDVCRVDLWGAERHEIPNQGKVRSLLRACTVYPRLVWRFSRAARADVVLVLYPGWFDMLVVGTVARLRRMPVIFDVFISLYDTVVSDRKLASSRSLLGRVCKIVDWLSLRAASRVIADTPEHAHFFATLAGIPRDRIGVVWVGAQDVFTPHPRIEMRERLVLFYGTYIGLHGVPTIIEAAKLLDAEGVSFRIIGSGQERARVDALCEELQPQNLERVERVPLEQLPREIAAATVCLGIFGTSDKAARVVPNKVYECVAVGRPVITAGTPAIASAFTPEEIATVPAGDAEALAAEIRRLLADGAAREAIAKAGHERYEREYSAEPLSRLLASELQRARG
jgi:glycosyltransferase involved in cell wall biosynthesis